MLWWLASRAASGAVRSAMSARTPPPAPVLSERDRRFYTAAGAFIFAFLAPVMVAIIVSGYHGHVSGVACAVYIVAFTALVLLGVPLAKLVYDRAGRQALHRRWTPPPDRYSPEALRARAAELGAVEALPEAERLERQRRVADLYAVACGDCPALGGQECIPSWNSAGLIPLARVQGWPPLYCHLSRVKDAVVLGAARLDEVKAQFGGKLPDEIYFS